MSVRIDPTWVVFRSVEDAFHERCVDLFQRPDGSFGFEEFRRDIEDQGRWTAVQYFSGRSFVSQADAWDAAQASVPWLPKT